MSESEKQHTHELSPALDHGRSETVEQALRRVLCDHPDPSWVPSEQVHRCGRCGACAGREGLHVRAVKDLIAAVRADAQARITCSSDQLEAGRSPEQEQIERLTKELARRDALRHTFGFILGPDGKCACAYCVGDTDALVEHAAEYEMLNLTLTEANDKLKARAERAERRLQEAFRAGFVAAQRSAGQAYPTLRTTDDAFAAFLAQQETT